MLKSVTRTPLREVRAGVFRQLTDFSCISAKGELLR